MIVSSKTAPSIPTVIGTLSTNATVAKLGDAAPGELWGHVHQAVYTRLEPGLFSDDDSVRTRYFSLTVRAPTSRDSQKASVPRPS